MNTLLELTWRGALMLVVVTSLDRLCAARTSARMRRAWWLLVPLAFLVTVPLPILPTARSTTPQFAPSYGPVAWFIDVATRPVGQANAIMPSSTLIASWALVFVLAGSAVYLLAVLGRTCSALRRWNRVPLCLDPGLLLALEECKAEAGIAAPVALVVSERVAMPLILGWRRPRILLPGTLVASLSHEQLRGVLFHELAHLRSLDVPCTFLFTLVCALHWFNPAAHLALRRWAQFREEAADEAAIHWLGQGSDVDYGKTLLHVLRHTSEQPAGPFLTLSIVESVSQLRTRLTMIKHHQRKSSHPLFTGTIFAAAALGIILRPVHAQDAPAQAEPPPATVSEKPALTSSAWASYDQSTLVAEFKREGYTIPEAIIDERVNTIVREEFKGDQAAFAHTLAAQGFTEEKFREAERGKVMAQAMRFQLMKESQTARAKTLIVPRIEVNSLPLSETIKLLAQEVSHLVPEGQGMDVQLDPQAPQAFKDARVTLHLHDVSPLDVLQSIAEQTNGKVTFSRQGIGMMAKPIDG